MVHYGIIKVKQDLRTLNIPETGIHDRKAFKKIIQNEPQIKFKKDNRST